MATASAVQSTRRVWHTRGNWNTRDDRTAPAIWLAIFWVGTIAGFGVDFPRFLQQKPPAPRVIHVHAAIFTIWLLILTTQVLLVLRDRVAWHRKMGWFAAGWACLMAVYGPWAAMASQVSIIHMPFANPQFLALNFVDITGFLVLLGCGLALRKNPAAHRRMMMLSTVSLADPGFNRFIGWIDPHEPTTAFVWFIWVFYGNILLIALMTAWDWYRGRIMRSFVVGAIGLLAAEYICALLYFSPAWKAMTANWVATWVQHVGR